MTVVDERAAIGPSCHPPLTGHEEGGEHLPVVDGGRVVGICTRADLLQVRLRELDQERVERGWLPARLPTIGS